jgi:cation diffusion facilitator CzcD-associated flavoprotein CzcO
MRTVIVGAGFGGIAAATELIRRGYNDITVLESAPALGGTWHYNTYPGAACDVPSHLYSFSYAQRSDWSRMCSPQQEILTYIGDVAGNHGIDERIVTGITVTACIWDDAQCEWHLEATDPDGHPSTWTADAVIMATGQLHQPAVPDIAGAETFGGAMFHSARWDHAVNLDDKRVAVIGTGASAAQLVPEIAPQVSQLTVFQRTGNWFMPRKNQPYPQALTYLFGRFPRLNRLWRWVIHQYMESLTASIRHPRSIGVINRLVSTAFMRRQLRDPVLRRKAWPDYPFGCKRILFSSAFLPALQRPNVDLVTEPITQITTEGILTGDGTHHRFDAIIYATGFKTNNFMLPMHVSGTKGQTLAENWADGAHAHLGITVSGFPSLFIMYGPNTNSSGGSVIFFLEAQARWIRRALDHARRLGAAAVNIRADVEAQSAQRIQAQFAGTTWTQCNSWYQHSSGRIVANWPGYMRDYATQTQRFDLDDIELIYPAHHTQRISS